MHDGNDRIEIAVGALRKLSDLHLKFMQIVSDMEGNDLPVGVLRVEDDELKATCLGVDLSVNHRSVVVRNGLPSILEYSFKVLWNDKDIDILKCILSQEIMVCTKTRIIKNECVTIIINIYLSTF